MNTKNYFSTENELYRHIRDILRVDGVGDSFIDEYLDEIFTYGAFEDYQNTSDNEIRDDFKNWMSE